MTAEQLRKHHRAQPFQPFDVYLADGRNVSVNHPECLAITPQGRTIGVALPDGTIETIDLLLVTGLKPKLNGEAAG